MLIVFHSQAEMQSAMAQVRATKPVAERPSIYSDISIAVSNDVCPDPGNVMVVKDPTVASLLHGEILRREAELIRARREAETR